MVSQNSLDQMDCHLPKQRVLFHYVPYVLLGASNFQWYSPIKLSGTKQFAYNMRPWRQENIVFVVNNYKKTGAIGGRNSTPLLALIHHLDKIASFLTFNVNKGVMLV